MLNIHDEKDLCVVCNLPLIHKCSYVKLLGDPLHQVRFSNCHKRCEKLQSKYKELKHDLKRMFLRHNCRILDIDDY